MSPKFNHSLCVTTMMSHFAEVWELLCRPLLNSSHWFVPVSIGFHHCKRKNTWNNQLIGNKSLFCSVLEVVWEPGRDSTPQWSRRSYGVLGAWSNQNKREKEEHTSNVSFKCMLQLTRRSTKPHLLESLLLANNSPKRIYPLTCGCLGNIPNESQSSSFSISAHSSVNLHARPVSSSSVVSQEKCRVPNQLRIGSGCYRGYYNRLEQMVLQSIPLRYKDKKKGTL